ncbi:isochorismatase family protein [Paenibacillus validus]|uniref:Isochorismatase family protein n=1 Tax=Paenibacillus validus TaxID=44253 RepID=A0A7X3CU51_9BACL|nr:MULTISPECIES: isochorismatase family protein [Paenibacillus]MED4601638.1 isochorismatase family protein [Paenibacillus validus]MED4605619.1 isochorismatase family protein [Paenibacillus validus]MUG72371.1 isochorismatase family protein [Paenibacillus validus]
MDKDYITIAEAAKKLGVSPATLRRLEKDGQVEGYGLKVYYTPGGQRRYQYNEVKHAYGTWGPFGRMGFGNKPCIIVRDLIRYFTDPTSKAGYDMDKVIEQTHLLLESATKLNIPIVFAVTIYDPNNKISNLWAKKIETNLMLKQESIWTDIEPRLGHFQFNKIIHSPYISPFFKSDLSDWLKAQDIDTVIIVGNSTSGCIRVTAIDSLQHGFHTIVPEEAVADRSITEHQTALLELDVKYADVIRVDEVLEYFQKVQI